METPTMPFLVNASLERIVRLLPPQGPIKDFVAQNTLAAFLDTPYDEAVEKAAKLFKARAYMELSYYRDAYSLGSITRRAFMDAIDFHIHPEQKNERALIERALFSFNEIQQEDTLFFLARQAQLSLEMIKNSLHQIHEAQSAFLEDTVKIKDLMLEQLGLGFEHQVNQTLFRLLGAYMDQGVSLWPFMDKKQSFIANVHTILRESAVPLAPFINNGDLASWLNIPPVEAVMSLLRCLLADESLYDRYIEESILAHPGWSAMVHLVAENPRSLAHPCDITVLELVVLKLALEWQFIKHRKHSYQPLSLHDWHHSCTAKRSRFTPSMLGLVWFIANLEQDERGVSTRFLQMVNANFLQKIWHRSLEYSYYQNIGAMFDQNQSINETKSTVLFQAAFCLDDRECSMRRLLELESPHIETFGTAGFFGINYYFESSNNALQKMCPLSVTPKHVITETPSKDGLDPERTNIRELASFMSRHGANSTLLGLFSSYTFGHLSMVSLMASLLHPFQWLKAKKIRPSFGSRMLNFERSEEQGPRADGLLPGFTHKEMADKIYATLNAMSLKNFAKIVFIIGHSSSSVNNPHFAAYDCGACSGRPGALNARIFALMANLKAVRELLATKGLTIPHDTRFIGGLHDTCTDEIEFFDTDQLSAHHCDLLQQFKLHLSFAQKNNARERCKKFALVDASIPTDKALLEVRLRAHALFEPRPELGHASNALTIVGRRLRSVEKNLDRRAFLQSYDPTSDPDGKILGTILQAVFPVCGGINLVYHFSRLDPAIYGCGTKLSHNVCSLLGVGNGLDDDLRTGLPVQMTETHVPIRLLVIIEQTPEIILKTVSENPTIWPWMKNAWLRVASLSPDKNILQLYEPMTHAFTLLA